MMDTATIRKATGGYIVTVRYPLAGTPLGGGEMVCTTFDEAVGALYEHLHPGKGPWQSNAGAGTERSEHACIR